MPELKPKIQKTYYFVFWVLGLMIPLIVMVLWDNMPRYRAIRDLNRAGIERVSDSVHRAVREGDVSALRLLHTAEVSFGERDFEGRTALVSAVTSRNIDVVEFLAGLPELDCDQVDEDGVSPLAHAISFGNLDAVKCLLVRVKNPNVELVWRGGRTHAILKATQERDGTLLRLLLMHPGIDVDVVDDSGKTPLHYAIKQDDLLVARALVSGGRSPNPNIASFYGETPLQYAIHAGRSDAVKLLLDNGAKIEEDFKESFLLKAVVDRDPATVGQLLKYGVSPNTRHPENKLSLLNYAIDEQATGCVVAFLSAGAIPSGTLERAIRCGQSEAARLIVSHHQAKDKSWAQKDGLLELAIYSNSADCVDLILDNGADPDQMTSSGQSVLAMALAAGSESAVSKLLDLGADPNAVLVSPIGSEYLSFFEGDSKTIYYLKRDRNITPLMLACLRELQQAVHDLVDHGAKRDAYTSRYKRYAVAFAAERRNVPIMQMCLGREANDLSRKAIVSLSEQHVTLLDGEGKTISRSPVSTGKRGYRTPSGTFVVTNKYRHHNSSLYGSAMPFFMRLSCSDFGLHYSASVPRYPASHGCIRMPWTEAQSFFKIMQVGDVVQIVK